MLDVKTMELLIQKFLENNTTDFPLVVINPSLSLNPENPDGPRLTAYMTQSIGYVRVMTSDTCESIMVVSDNPETIKLLSLKS